MDTIVYEYEQREDKSEMTHIVYHYVTGESVKVEIAEELRPVLTELKRLEDNCTQRENRRRKASLRSVQNYISSIAEDVERREQNDEFMQAFHRLLPEQQKLLWQIFFLEIPEKEIARREGVDKSAISHRLKRARAKLKNLQVTINY